MKTNFEALRKKAGYSQQELANELGITRARYVNYEIGRTEADYDTLLKLSHIYGETINTILGDEATHKETVSINLTIEDYEKLKGELSDIIQTLISKKSK
ncbi:MAG: helix-turn-helix domain-containing protein [Treponema sp.]|nr:helix-turn-helix domain-containing protein [Treponema sp.]